LSGSDLISGEADLSKANLTKAKLHGANLINVKLYGANLSKAELCEADLCGAKMDDKTYLSGAKLQGAKYNKEAIQKMNDHENLVTIGPTQWPSGFNYKRLKAAGAICVDGKKKRLAQRLANNLCNQVKRLLPSHQG
jgi:uncharacterized protein YjbI with pentapeptide repeats